MVTPKQPSQLAGMFGSLLPPVPLGPQGVQVADLVYRNNGATRNRKLTPGLEKNISDAVDEVYGPGYVAQVYSGGQPGKGEGGARTGSIRHDHGRAADVYILDPNGKRLTGDALAPLGQHWTSKRLGGLGMEMRGGGVHLDEWTTPPPGGGMAWNYANQGGQYTAGQKQAVAKGLAGQTPMGTMLAGDVKAYKPGAVAALSASGPIAPGAPAPALGATEIDAAPVAVAQAVPPPAAPPPVAPAEPAAPTTTGKIAELAAMFGSMEPQRPQFAPVQFNGPSPQQANALTSMIQMLRNQRLA